MLALFRNLSILSKISLPVIIVLAASIGIFLYARSALSTLHDGSIALISGPSRSLEQALDIQAALLSGDVALRDAVLNTSTVESNQAEESRKKRFADMIGRIDQAMATATPGVAAILTDLKNQMAAYQEAYEQIALLAEFNNFEKAVSGLRDNVGPIRGKIESLIGQWQDGARAMVTATLTAQDQGFNRAVGNLAGVSVLGYGLSLGLLLLIGVAGIARPLRAIAGQMTRLAEGELAIAVVGADRRDEVGMLARALEVFRAGAAENIRLQQAAEENRQREASLAEERDRAARAAAAAEKTRLAEDLARAEIEQQRAARIARAVADFEAGTSGIIESLATAARHLQTSADDLSGLADQTRVQTDAVASGAEQASSNVETVATATEQLTASSQEIGRQASQSADMTRRVVGEAGRAAETMASLEGATRKIDEVAHLIDQIAGQTNLLALNATIEAARAGEAGKGFAIVASEVKTLAGQTAKATEQIARQIEEIQTSTRDAAAVIGVIRQSIDDMSENAVRIASAVEEQVAATGEIARNVDQAARGTHEVFQAVGAVRQAVGNAGSAAGRVLSASTELTGFAETLRAEVNRFLASVRAGER